MVPRTAGPAAGVGKGITVRQLWRTILFGLALAAAGCDVGGGDVTATASGANAVNGSITVPAGLQSGTVDTVNGSIHVGDNASVATASTVNGSINLGAKATADSLTTVNGSIHLDTDSKVRRNVSSVNGSLHLKEGADVTGLLSNVNGSIVLHHAHVGGGVRTVDGNIDILGGSHVEGGIVMKKSTGWFNLTFGSTPRVVIGPGSVVDGELRFEREVELYVSDKATVGPIIGAAKKVFSGDSPPSGN
jgi:DUF4097 and DUF4098 domain-containing protein YvlB